MSQFSHHNNPKRQEPLKLGDTLAKHLPAEIVADLRLINFKWPENSLLQTVGAQPNDELIAWCLGKLASIGTPTLKSLQILSDLYPANSAEQAAFLELKERAREGEPLITLYDRPIWEVPNGETRKLASDKLLIWENIPSLQRLADHFRILATDHSNCFLTVMMFSFCPWSEEYAASHRVIKKAMTEEAWKRSLETGRGENFGFSN